MRVLFLFFSNFFNWVRALVLITGGALAACIYNLVLCASAVVWNLVLCFLVRCLWFVFVHWSTLGTDGVDNWGTWGFGGVMDIFCRVLLLVYSGTLRISGAPVVVVGAVALDVLCCNARSFIWISCRISSPPLLLPKFLFLWRSLLLRPSLFLHVWWWVRWDFCDWNVWCLWRVFCWWILCGIYVFGSILVMSPSAIHWQCDITMCLFRLSFHVLVMICPLVLVEFCYS